MRDTRQIHSLSGLLRNHKAHVARLKETRTPAVLTVNGRAEVVLLDTESCEALMARLRREEDMAYVRQAIERGGPGEPVSEAEIARSGAVMRELVAETERLGLCR